MSDELLILIITHLVSDLLLQPGKWGAQKVKIFKYRLLHSVQYCVLFLVVFYFLEINLVWLIWIFATHLFIDSYKFITFWNNKIRSREFETPHWMIIAQDQILHILVLVPIVLIN